MTSSGASPLSAVLTFTYSGGAITSYSPYAAVYGALGGDLSVHLYSANLSNGAATPVPQQISSFGLSPSLLSQFNGNCISSSFQNVADPSTYFFFIEVPTSQPCGGGSAANSFYLIHFTDAAGTAPVTLPASITTTKAEGTYSASTGKLTGLVIVDSTGNLNWYPVNGSSSVVDFTNPTTVASGVTFQGHLAIVTDRTGKVFTPGTLVFSNVANSLGTSLVYRIDSTGASKLVYTAAGTINGAQLGNGTDVHDNTNIYFYDAVGSFLAYTSVKFVALPISGAAATTLYTNSSPVSGQNYSLYDTDGTYLIFQSEVFTGTTSNDIVTLLTHSTSQSPVTLVAGVPATAYFPYLDYASDHLFLTEYGAITPTEYSSAVYVPSSGTALPGVGGANTAFSPFSSSQLKSGGAKVLEFTNLNTTTAAYAGASLFTMDPSTLATIQVTQGGSDYVVPAGAKNVGMFGLSPTIGIGQVALSGNAYSGLAIDVSKSEIITITQTGDNVTVF